MLERPRYYRRDGTPIYDVLDWAKSFEDRSQKRVAETTLPDGKWVSTVWLGLDHNFGDDGPPLIFETMVFPDDNIGCELDCERYSTEAEAVEGHKRMVEKWSHPQPYQV